MTSRDVRRTFLEFFGEREHRVVPSSPLVLPHDPTLLFVNAGMNQFKDVFTGKERRDYRRAVSSQKCLRVSGKHNDLEMVGRTPRHHTFFEMLGNFSFGDYFKEQAIAYAWELVTRVYGLPGERLWISVFAGTDEVPADHEALAVWRDRIGVAPERILQLGERDNFWRMGDTGPCGPSSEIHFDLGEDLTSVEGDSTPGTDERRYIEIWNLVFMEFNQREHGGLEPLPAPSVDTGMGLERITSVLQGQRSNYDTDLFRPLMEATAGRAGVRSGEDPEQDVSLRVIADHVRAFCFLIADGVAPANDKRGYVLRRVLRRAIRHGHKLGIDEPFLHEISPVVLDTLGDVYPELLDAREAILEVGRREEERFAETLTTGLQVLEQSLEGLEGQAEPVLAGSDLFRLYDTFGFPLDLARDIAEERGVRLDEAGFEAEMTKQRARARASWKGAGAEAAAGIYHELASRHASRFEGYHATSLDGVPIVAMLREASPVEVLQEGQDGEVLLEATPFYAEAGGQVGDRGWLSGPNGRARVTDTQRPVEGLILHRVCVDGGQLRVGDPVLAAVDAARRDAIRRNHTGTHLLHAALREAVGTHVRQAGSLVAPRRLRFDFTHFSGLSERAVEEIESRVNEQVLEDTVVETEIMDLDQALSSGAMALFGEKYGDPVRVVRIGDFSLELCGGTHCERTGEVGLFKLTQERGIASGTRRVEAVTGDVALERFRELQETVLELEGLLSVGRRDLVPELEKRIEAAKSLASELERLRLKGVREAISRAAESPEVVAGVKVVAERVDGLGPKELRPLADELRAKLGSGVVVLGRADGSKASLLVAVTKDLEQRLPAGELVRSLARLIGGRGGGRSDLAEAGGKDPGRLDEALRRSKDEVAGRMEAGR